VLLLLIPQSEFLIGRGIKRELEFFVFTYKAKTIIINIKELKVSFLYSS